MYRPSIGYNRTSQVIWGHTTIHPVYTRPLFLLPSFSLPLPLSPRCGTPSRARVSQRCPREHVVGSGSAQGTISLSLVAVRQRHRPAEVRVYLVGSEK